MSNTNEVLSAISEAHNAFLALPELQRKIEALEQAKESISAARDRAEQAHINATDQIAELQEKLRRAEAERDQYGFRNLELEDQIGKVRSLIGAPIAPVSEVDASPAQPVSREAQPTVVEPLSNQPTGVYPGVGMGQSVSDPSTGHAATATASATASEPVSTPVTAGSGGDSGPFADASSQGGSGTASAVPSTEPDATSTSASPSASTGLLNGLYHGLRYYDKPRDVSWEVFEAGGGEHKPVWMD